MKKTHTCISLAFMIRALCYFFLKVKDIHGNESAQITWNQPGNDITGLIARCDKVAGTAEKVYIKTEY